MLTSRATQMALGVLSLLMSAAGICEEAKTSVPKEIGGLPYKSAKKYEEAALGISLSYQGDGAALTIYLYGGGIAEIPAGITSDIFAAQFAQAQSDILGQKEWTDVKLTSDVSVMLAGRNLKMRKAVYEMSVGETPYTSILYLTAARNRFYKARLTAPKKSPALQDERLASIEHDLGELITSWITR